MAKKTKAVCIPSDIDWMSEGVVGWKVPNNGHAPPYRVLIAGTPQRLSMDAWRVSCRTDDCPLQFSVDVYYLRQTESKAYMLASAIAEQKAAALTKKAKLYLAHSLEVSDASTQE